MIAYLEQIYFWDLSHSRGQCKSWVRSFVGMHASIAENLTIAERTIGANSLILNNIDQTDRTVFGVPGRHI